MEVRVIGEIISAEEKLERRIKYEMEGRVAHGFNSKKTLA